LLLAFVSDCEATARILLLTRLQELLPGKVHLYGDCFEPSPCPGRDESDQCHQDLFASHLFYAAFENRRCSGYITEKFFRGLHQGMVPLVMGARDNRTQYEEIAPVDSFIHVDDFPSAESLAERLSTLSLDRDAVGSYFAWRTHSHLLSVTGTVQKSFCNLCNRLQDDKATNVTANHRAWSSNLDKWWYDESCLEHDGPAWAFALANGTSYEPSAEWANQPIDIANRKLQEAYPGAVFYPA